MHTQLELLPVSAPLRMARARRRADTGIARSAQRAERCAPGWMDLAIEALRRYALSAAKPFTVEAARAHFAAALTPPPDERAWGAVTRIARQRGVIEHTGSYAPADSSNGSPKPLYRRGINA